MAFYAVACASGWYKYSAEGEVEIVAIPDYSSHPWTLFSTFHLKLFSAIPQAQCLALDLDPGPMMGAAAGLVSQQPGGAGVPALHVAPFHPTYSSHSAAT